MENTKTRTADADLEVSTETRVQDPQVSLLSHAIFWRPRYIVASPLLRQLPYMFWLMEAIRPTTVAQIGIGDGLIYMALCQAVERLGTRTLCTGYIHNCETLSVQFLTEHNEHYDEFSQLVSEDVIIRSAVPKANIDMLVLNLDHSDSQPEILLEEWLPRLSKKAVVLVCNPEITMKHDSLRDALIRSPKNLYITGPHSPGQGKLDVILYGESQSDQMLQLADLSFSHTAQLGVKRALNRLGQSLEDKLNLDDFRRQNLVEKGKHDLCRDEINSLRTQLAEYKNKVTQLESAEEAAFHQAASVEITRKTRVAQTLVELEKTLVQERQAHADDRTQLIALDNKIKNNEIQRKSLMVKISETKRKLISTERELKENIKLIKSLKKSTSWRITKPIRKLKQVMSKPN